MDRLADPYGAIETNRVALKRILASLVAMVAMADGTLATRLPRRLHSAVLSLLRPAESAARRLVIVVARGITVALPVARPLKPKPVSAEPMLRSLGLAVVLSPADIAARAKADRLAAARAARRRSAPAVPVFSLFDPPRYSFRPQRRTVPAHVAPRIISFGDAPRHTLPPRPAPDDPLDATRLGLRFQALGRVLDDLPSQANRFAHWMARRNACRVDAAAQSTTSNPPNGKSRDAGSAHRFRRIWPLRSGRPPGGRLSRYDPGATRRRHVREVDEILAHAHALAVYALEQPDTS